MAETVHLYLKVNGNQIKGESTQTSLGREGSIECIYSEQAVTSAREAGTNMVTGRRQFTPLKIVKRIDRASPLLMKACATGMHIKDATITHRKSGKGQTEYLVVKLNDIIITGVSHGGGAGGQPVSESVTMAFAKVDLEYRPQRADGSLDAGIHFKYDIKANKEG